MPKINIPEPKKSKMQNKDQELEKLEKITEAMRNNNKLLKRTEKDDESFAELIYQLLEIDSNNHYVTLFKFCVAYIDNFYLRINNSLMENHVKALKTMIETGVENSKEISELRTKVLDQYDKIISSIKFSNYLFEERNELMDIAFQAKVYYPPFKKDFDIIHKEKIRTDDEKQFAISILDEVKSKKASFLMLLYRNRNDSKFLRIFPKLLDIDFTKLKSEFSDDRIMFNGIYEEYFIKFCDSFKPSKKKPKKKKLPSKKK